MKVFDFVSDASYDKKDILIDCENRAMALKIYSPYIVNKAFSHFSDTIFISNELNQMPDLPNDLQYHCYLYQVRKRKRFGKWPKGKGDDNIEAISKYYQININKAKEYLKILTPEQVKEICSKFELNK